MHLAFRTDAKMFCIEVHCIVCPLSFDLLLIIYFTELFYTERAHVRMLKVLDNVFYQPLTREAILPPADIKTIFTNLEEIVQLHGKYGDSSQKF